MHMHACVYRGIHYIGKKVRERIQHIAEELVTYDIIGLQEVREC